MQQLEERILRTALQNQVKQDRKGHKKAQRRHAESQAVSGTLHVSIYSVTKLSRGHLWVSVFRGRGNPPSLQLLKWYVGIGEICRPQKHKSRTMEVSLGPASTCCNSLFCSSPIAKGRFHTGGSGAGHQQTLCSSSFAIRQKMEEVMRKGRRAINVRHRGIFFPNPKLYDWGREITEEKLPLEQSRDSTWEAGEKKTKPQDKMNSVWYT